MARAARTVPLADADSALADFIRNAAVAARSERVIAVAAPPGAGKTRAVCTLAEELAPLVYCSPDHERLREVQAVLRDRGVQVERYQGVGSACEYSAAFEYYGRRIDWRRRACKGCGLKATCGAWATSRIRPSVLLAATDALPVLAEKFTDAVPLLAGALVVLDEGWASIELRSLSRQKLLQPLALRQEWGEAWESVRAALLGIEFLLELAASDPSESVHARRIHGHALLEIGQHANLAKPGMLPALRRLVGEPVPAPTGRELRERLIERADSPDPGLLSFLGGFLGVVESGAEARLAARRRFGSMELAITGRSVAAELRRPRPIPAEASRGVVVLDAAAALGRPEWEAASGGRRIALRGIEISPRPDARIERMHLATKSATRRCLFKGGAVTRRGRGTLRRALERVSAHWTESFGGEGRVAVLTFRPLVKAFPLDEVARVLGSSGLRTDRSLLGYYGRDDRGSNTYQQAEVLVTFGDPVDNVGATQADARALGLDGDELIASRTQVSLLQAQGRARAVRATRQLLVHVGVHRPPGWEGACQEEALPVGRPGHPCRDRVLRQLEELLRAGESVTVEAAVKLAETVTKPSCVAFSVDPPSPSTARSWLEGAARRVGAARTVERHARGRRTVWQVPAREVPPFRPSGPGWPEEAETDVPPGSCGPPGSVASRAPTSVPARPASPRGSAAHPGAERRRGGI